MGDDGSSMALFLPGGQGSEHGRSGSVDRLQPRFSPRRPPMHASPRSLQPTHLLPELHQTPQSGSNQFHFSFQISLSLTAGATSVLLRILVFQEREASQLDLPHARFQRTDQWIPVYSWLETLDKDEVVKSKEISDWLTENPKVQEQLCSRHSRYHLMHYIKKCHLKILKRRDKKKVLNSFHLHLITLCLSAALFIFSN